MTCTETRLALLDAEPGDLDASHDGVLAQHLRTCAACRAQAAAISLGTAALRAALDEAVAERLQKEAGRDDVALDGHVLPLRSRLRAARVLVPLAAAAALALLLIDGDVLRPPFTGGGPHVGLYLPEPEVPSAPVVNATGASGVAVMQTTNPSITVVWTF